MKFDGVIRTQLRDQSFEQDERGARCWRSAELVSDGWFVVEHCLVSEGVREVRQWIATSITECARLIRADEAQWSRLLAYLRAPLSAGQGFVFAEVTEAHEVGSSGRLLLRFADGTTVLTPGHDGESALKMLNAEELRLVFSKRPGAVGSSCHQWG